MDRDGSGLLTYPEFLDMMNATDTEETHKLFTHFDAGGDGEIEVIIVLTSLI